MAYQLCNQAHRWTGAPVPPHPYRTHTVLLPEPELARQLCPFLMALCQLLILERDI
jgi:hypothetical protein